MFGPLFALATAVALTQNPQAAPARTQQAQPQGEALRVFLDCQWQCDEDFLRTEITFVNYVLDRAVAQVHVLVTTMETGGGGDEFTLTFIGLREYAGRTDTLRFATQSTDTEDEARRELARNLRLGLVRYIAGTPLARHLNVTYTPPQAAAAPSREQHDPWNHWVFRVSLNGYYDGERSNASHSWSGSLDASRTTAAWKTQLSLHGSDSRNRFTYEVEAGRDTTIRTMQQSWHGTALVVRSIGAHWSAGFTGELYGSTSQNTDARAGIAPAIEFDLFPYAEATRRQVTFSYSVGPVTAHYRDTTIYSVIRETYLKHTLNAALEFEQPWGNADLSVSGTQYWNDVRNPNVDIWASTEIRIVRGLSANFWGGYSFVRSQRYLSAADATQEEVLLQLRQMRTSYEYYMGFGFSYRFGSVYNNVVNPRFDNLD